MNLEELLNKLDKNEYSFYRHIAEEMDEVETTIESKSVIDEYWKTLESVFNSCISHRNDPKTESFLKAMNAIEQSELSGDSLAEKMREMGMRSYVLMDNTDLFNNFDLRWMMYFDDDNILGIRYDETIDEDGTDETAIMGLSFVDEDDFEECYSIFSELVATKVAIAYANDSKAKSAIVDILNFELESIGSDISLSEEDIPNPLSDINVFALFETIFLSPLLIGTKELDVEYNY